MSDSLDELIARKKVLIRALWVTYVDISDLVNIDEFEEKDLELWEKITAHPAVQNVLAKSVKL